MRVSDREKKIVFTNQYCLPNTLCNTQSLNALSLSVYRSAIPHRLSANRERRCTKRMETKTFKF